MLTYQVRPRVFRHDAGTELRLPATCVLRFHLMPGQPFGTSATGGRTAVQNKPGAARFNATTGEHFIESKEPLPPLDVTLSEPNRLVRLKGSVLEITEDYDNLSEVEDVVMGVYFGLPVLLNVGFGDPPIVFRVDGEIGGVPFRWELKDWRMNFTITTQERQEGLFVTAFQRMSLVAGLPRRRLLAALHYFHVASRLNCCGAKPGEFMAEAILNLAKTLEVLFPSAGNGQTREAARQGISELGYSDDEIERLFIPAMALRNEIDVGHVHLALFNPRQLAAIHAYTEIAEDAFRDMLDRVLTAVAEGKWQVSTMRDCKASPGALKVVERLVDQFGKADD